MNIVAWLHYRHDRRLTERIAELESQLDAANRSRAVVEAERDTLAAVVIRERARVEAETAIFTRQRAEAEGQNEQRDFEGQRRRIA